MRPPGPAAAPGARVWVVKFGDAAARDAAWLRFMTHRRGLGTAYAWTHGPPLIMVDGPRTPEVASMVMGAVTGAGAQ